MKTIRKNSFIGIALLLTAMSCLASGSISSGTNRTQQITTPIDTAAVLAEPQPDANAVNDAPHLSQVVELPMTRLEFNLSIGILLFGLLLIIAEMYLVRSKNINAEDTIKFIVITIIIISTLYLITAGYSNDQIAPAMGLLGTIAGYLLGKINTVPINKQHHENEEK